MMFSIYKPFLYIYKKLHTGIYKAFHNNLIQEQEQENSPDYTKYKIGNYKNLIKASGFHFTTLNVNMKISTSLKLISNPFSQASEHIIRVADPIPYSKNRSGPV